MRFSTTLLAAFVPFVSLWSAPPEVSVIHPVEREVKDEQTFTGRTAANTTVDIRARESGLIEKILFKEGSNVKKGEILIQFDARVQALAEFNEANGTMYTYEDAELDSAAVWRRFRELTSEGCPAYRLVADPAAVPLDLNLEQAP